MSVVHCAAFHQSKNATRWSEGKLVITSFLADLSGSGWVGGEGAERERERERQRQRQRQRQTDRQTEKETERKRDRERQRQRDRENK